MASTKVWRRILLLVSGSNLTTLKSFCKQRTTSQARNLALLASTRVKLTALAFIVVETVFPITSRARFRALAKTNVARQFVNFGGTDGATNTTV
jgi:hypothetical protein